MAGKLGVQWRDLSLCADWTQMSSVWNNRSTSPAVQRPKVDWVSSKPNVVLEEKDRGEADRFCYSGSHNTPGGHTSVVCASNEGFQRARFKIPIRIVGLCPGLCITSFSNTSIKVVRDFLQLFLWRSWKIPMISSSIHKQLIVSSFGTSQ